MNVHSLNIRKKGETASEFFSRLASAALEKPEDFKDVLVIFKKDGMLPVTHDYGESSRTEALGMLEVVKYNILRDEA